MELKQGYKQTEVGVIPIVWDVVPFDEIANKHKKWSITGGPFGSNLKVSDYTVDGIQIIQLQNIGDGVFHDESQIFTSYEKANELLSCNIYAGEIILSKMGDPVARACFIPNKAERYVMASDGIRLVVDEAKFSKKFIHEYINSSYFRRRAFEISTGTTRQRIGLPELKTLLVICPPLHEQTAIANALSDMDALIAQTEKLIEKKKAIKHGVMQELLKPKEGWVTKKLGEVCELRNGYSFQSQCYCEGGAYNIITISNVQDGILESSNFSKIAQMPIDIQSHQILKKGDILISLTGNVGRLCKVNIDNCLLNQRVGKLSPTTINHDFLYCILQNSDFRRVMIQSAVGGAQGNIGKDTVLNYTIEYPLSKTEQIDIASAFSDLTAEIGELSTKLQKLKLQKQGMMQALLTGKIRLI